jgi:small subunit ribosomal protein S1
MDTERRDLSSPPPPLDEGYWNALLHQGEYAEAQPLRTPDALNGNTHITAPSPSSRASQPTWDNYAAMTQDWHDIDVIMQTDQTIHLHVTGYNRGGLLVEWRHIRGFVPASQLMHFPNGIGAAAKQEILAQRIGETLELRVIELNPDQNRLVLSERAAQVAPGTRAQILHEVHKGTTVEGTVTNITEFGVFVDLGGIEGLIHISELSWGRVGHPGDILRRGELVKAYVLDTNKDEGRIALSVKRLHPDPWQTIEERYKIGQVISGHITNVVEFGAFACIEDGLEGLIHISELAEGHFLHPHNVVQDGQIVQARILSIDARHRRLGLSLRQVEEPDE